MSKRRKKQRSTAPRRFKVGDRVRVNQGVMDVDYPEFPLGGWVGTISEIDRGGMYTIRWSRETLATIHPIYKKRCESDESVLEEYWLTDEDLHSDPGGPLSIEQPKEIKPRRLSAQNQGDRIRMVFALSGDDSLPGPDDEALATYYDYLATELSLPFEAKYYGEWAAFDRSRPRIVRAVGLGGDFDVDQGILCEIQTSAGDDLVPLVDLEIRRSDPNRQLVDDFAAWFAGELVSEFDEDDDEEPGADDELDEAFQTYLKTACQAGRLRRTGGFRIGPQPVRVEAGWLDVGSIYLEIIAFAASYGAVVGSAVAAMSWAKWAACMAGGLLGVVSAVSQASSAQRVWSRTVPRFRKPMGGVVGLMVGTLTGAFFGIMAVAFVGSLLGCAAGLLLERLFGRGKKVVLRVFPGWVLFAAAWGVAAQAFYVKPLEATEGLRYGTLAGLAAGLVFCLVSVPLAFLTTVRKPSSSRAAE